MAKVVKSNSENSIINSENKELIGNYLNAYPEVKIVYFNSDGAWSFHARTGFDTQVTRDEVLGTPTISEAPMDETPADAIIEEAPTDEESITEESTTDEQPTEEPATNKPPTKGNKK